MKQYIAKGQQKLSQSFIHEPLNHRIFRCSNLIMFQAEYVHITFISRYKMTEFKRAFGSFDMESLSLKTGNDIFTK